MTSKTKRVNLEDFQARAGAAHTDLISRVLLATISTHIVDMSNANKCRVLLRLAAEIADRLEALDNETSS